MGFFFFFLGGFGKEIQSFNSEVLFLFFRLDYLCSHGVVFLCSNSDSRLPETAQHQKPAGEQDRGCRAEEDPHGRHPGPPGPAGGENEQNSGFSGKQTEGMRRRCRASVSRVSSFFHLFVSSLFFFFPIFACIYMFVLENNVKTYLHLHTVGFMLMVTKALSSPRSFSKSKKLRPNCLSKQSRTSECFLM